MLKNRIMFLLSLTLLFTTMPSETLAPFQTVQISGEIVNNTDENYLHNLTDKRLLNLQQQYEEHKKENELKAKELAEKQKAEAQKVDKPSIESSNVDTQNQYQDFVLTFYTSLISENSNAGAITASGKPLSSGMVASNAYRMGTQIYLDGYGVKTVSDRGGSNFNSSSRLDVYVSRNAGESDYAYKKRVQSYGVKKVRGYIVR